MQIRCREKGSAKNSEKTSGEMEKNEICFAIKRKVSNFLATWLIVRLTSLMFWICCWEINFFFAFCEVVESELGVILFFFAVS